METADRRLRIGRRDHELHLLWNELKEIEANKCQEPGLHHARLNCFLIQNFFKILDRLGFVKCI